MLDLIKNRAFTIVDYTPYIGKLGNEQLQPLPNAESVDPMAFLNNLAAHGHGMEPVWGYAKLGERNQWTMFFLTSYMMSGLDGGGYAITYGGSRQIEGKVYATPRVVRFAICKHEKESTGTREQERRGYHPGSCRLCGYNLTYDSGD